MSLLIDGYNLLYAVGLLDPRCGPGGLERSRAALVARLAAALEPAELAETTIVFDAAGARRGGPQEFQSRGLTIRFAVGYEDADTLIEELIRQHPTPRRLVVVSSDHRVKRAARRRRATAAESEAWYDELLKRRQRRDESADPVEASEPRKVEKEVGYWLRQFGGESLVDEVEAEEQAREEASASPSPAADTDRGETALPDKLAPDEAAAIGNPFPPGYGEEMEEGPDDGAAPGSGRDDRAGGPG